MSRAKFIRCKGSGTEQMLDWLPDVNYPGASVCIYCSYGIPVRKRSAHEAVSGTGFHGMAGTLLVHAVKRDEYDEPAAIRFGSKAYN